MAPRHRAVPADRSALVYRGADPNPTFYRFFLFELNLQRFATGRYQHHQNPAFYLIVLLLALMPWTVLSLRALWDSVEIAIAEWRVRHKPARYLGHSRAGDAFPEFLVLWALFPVVFFSFSGSKLPGYILPPIPPLTILTGDYLFRVRKVGLPPALLWAHGAATGLLTFVLLLCPQYMVYQRMVPPARVLLVALLVGLATATLVVVVTQRFGLQWIRPITLTPVMLLLFFLLHSNGWLLDSNYSARPLARQITAEAPDVPLLVTPIFGVIPIRSQLLPKTAAAPLPAGNVGHGKAVGDHWYPKRGTSARFAGR